MRAFELIIKDKIYQVEIEDLNESPVEVTVNGRKYAVEVIERESRETAPLVDAKALPVSRGATAPDVPAPTPTGQPLPSGSTEVTAPMPGKILSVKVGEGDHVEVGQALCTLEAMKMEMAISSTASGTVVKISVEPGQTVNHGDALCVIA